MRVIAGKLKGRHLAPVRDASIRPTADRVRESLFGILRDAVPDSRFLDLCAGTGSVGIEAYSRGARDVVFVELKANAVLQTNLRLCGLIGSVQVLSMPVHRALPLLSERGEVFDVIFMDPPYDSSVIQQSLQYLSVNSLLHDEGCIVAEHRRIDPPAEAVGRLACVRHETYGDTVLSFYVWDQVEPVAAAEPLSIR